MSEIKSIVKWFETAKPEPTIEDLCVQVGCHYEEIDEMNGHLETKNDDTSYHADAFKECFANWLEELEKFCESKDNRIKLADDLFDQIITAVGVLKMMGVDVEGGLAESDRSNWSKLVDGKAVLDENSKIAKPATYFKPNLEPFVGELPWKK